MPRKKPADQAADINEMVKLGNEALKEQRAQRLKDIRSGDVKIDPDLLNEGDEVADEVVSEFKRTYQNLKGTSQELQDRQDHHGFSMPIEERRKVVQQAEDVMLEQNWSRSKAYDQVAKEHGIDRWTLVRYADELSMGDPMKSENKVEGRILWDVYRREQLFDEMLDVAKMLTDRMRVWLTPNLNADNRPPKDWNAANELKTIAVAAAIAHDKRSHLEDLKEARGLRDTDSVELQSELAEGRKRISRMTGNDKT